MRRLAAAIGLMIGLAASPALAAKPPADFPPCARIAPEVVAADQAMFDQALAAFDQDGWPALKSRLPEMEAAVARAPATFNVVERCDGALVIHADSQDQFLAFARKFDGETTRWQRWPYADLTLILGATYVEYRDYDRAIPVLLKAVAMSPGDARIVGEAGTALSLGGQPQKALKLAEDTLAAYPDIEPRQKARLHRIRGFSFVEMSRLDEAEAAYRESLEYDASNPTAKGELEYIAGLRAGGQKTVGQPVNSKTGEPNDH